MPVTSLMDRSECFALGEESCFQIIKMMMTVVGIYATCWLPIHLITILGDTNPYIWENPIMRYVWLSAHWLAMSSCMYNPLIYWWMSEKFRWGYKFLVRKIKYQCCKCGHDHMMLMNMRGTQFVSTYSQAYSQAYDFTTRAFRNGEGGGSGGGRGNQAVNNGGGSGERGGGNYGMGVMTGDKKGADHEKEHKQNGVTFCCDLIVDRGETIPLRKTSDPAESGLGSDDGDDSEETCPTHV